MTSKDAGGKTLTCLLEITLCHIADDDNCDITMRMPARTTLLCILSCHFLYCFSVLSQVNITLLQASVVEEMISFSALDNIQDLTCVSLFAVCFDSITATFYRSKQVSSPYLFVGNPQVQQN